MNVNVAKANAILGMVSARTAVDSFLLIEDDEFCKLLTLHAHESPTAKAVTILNSYVNEKY